MTGNIARKARTLLLDPQPTRRVILLGASNVSRGLAAVVEACKLRWGQPLDLLAAIGHGRSFGRPSRVLARGLPGILECGLWDELAQRAPLPSAGLITDIGNDILFGASTETIAEWVESSLQRLDAVCEQLIVTELPLASIEKLGPRQFHFLRRILFPKSKIDFEHALSAARDLNTILQQLAIRYRAHVVRPVAHWYAIDPIHIRIRHWGTAWPWILRSWQCLERPTSAHDGSYDVVQHSWRLWLQLRTARPHERRMFGVTQRQTQPACVLSDGTRVSLY